MSYPVLVGSMLIYICNRHHYYPITHKFYVTTTWNGGETWLLPQARIWANTLVINTLWWISVEVAGMIWAINKSHKSLCRCVKAFWTGRLCNRAVSNQSLACPTQNYSPKSLTNPEMSHWSDHFPISWIDKIFHCHLASPQSCHGWLHDFVNDSENTFAIPDFNQSRSYARGQASLG